MHATDSKISVTRHTPFRSRADFQNFQNGTDQAWHSIERSTNGTFATTTNHIEENNLYAEKDDDYKRQLDLVIGRRKRFVLATRLEPFAPPMQASASLQTAITAETEPDQGGDFLPVVVVQRREVSGSQSRLHSSRAPSPKSLAPATPPATQLPLPPPPPFPLPACSRTGHPSKLEVYICRRPIFVPT